MAFLLPVRQRNWQDALRLSLALLLELLLAVVFSKLPIRQKKSEWRIEASGALPDCIIAMPASIATRPPRQLHLVHAGGHPALANNPTNKQEIKKDLTNARY